MATLPEAKSAGNRVKVKNEPSQRRGEKMGFPIGVLAVIALGFVIMYLIQRT
jgi:tetrahydromethanopterin S-methyltransferase subunit G